MKVRIHKVASLIDGVEGMRQQIAERSYEIFNLCGCALGRAVDDWLTADRERV